MRIEDVSNVYYVGGKNLKNSGVANKDLEVKVLTNLSPEKFAKIADRIVKLQKSPDGFTIKANAEITELLKEREFTNLVIKESSGERKVIQSHIQIQTLTADEAKELNQAVSHFLGSVNLARQEQEAAPEETMEAASESERRRAAVAGDKVKDKKGLKPSDYLREASAATATVRTKKGWVDSLKEEEERAKEHQRKYDEKKDALMRTIKNKENLKFDRQAKDIKKESTE